MAGENLKAVLVGCGSMSNAWLQTATKLDGLEMVALVDINRDAAAAKAKEYQLDDSVVFGSLGEAIDATAPDIVFDVTIPDAHDAVTIEALNAGCHVLGEKPMAVSLERAQKMVKQADQAGKLYAVIQNRRYEPNIQRVRQLIEQGTIGEVEEIHCDFYIGAHFGGFRAEMDHPLIVDMAIHTFDAARYIGGVDPVSVFCHAFNPGHSWYKGDASAIAIFEMQNNVAYSYRGSWCSEGLNTSWNSAWRVVGSRGTILWNGDADIRAEQLDPGTDASFINKLAPVEPPTVTVEHVGHAGLIREFVDCVRQGTQPQTICTDNIRSLAMVLAAVKSAESGQKEKVVW